MKINKNKKGFTLIELLAVIVILAVVMLIAATAVIPLMEKARMSALWDEAIALTKAADLKFQDPSNADLTGKQIFKVNELKTERFFDKGNADGYYGCVEVDASGDDYTYNVYLSNGNYTINGKNPKTTSYNNNVNKVTTNKPKSDSAVNDKCK